MRRLPLTLDMDEPVVNELQPHLLRIDVDDDSSHQMDRSWQWGETTYRCDGFSIGRDYLRLEGRTVARDTLKPEHLIPTGTVLGKGAFSTVQLATWKNKSQQMVEKVAIKRCCLLETSKERRRLLLQELRILCLIDCPALVKLHGAFLETDIVTTVLEYMDRGSLADLFASRNNERPRISLPQSLAAAIMFQALVGLSYLHNDRILHRDIKPANLLLHSDGSLKLCDFGMAVLDQESLHKTAVGTTVYMSPERLRGKPYGRSSDVWSLGLVMLQCFTGQPPPWSQVGSIVDLLMTVEEIVPEKCLIPKACNKNAGEMLAGCLQHEPAKRIPAALLRRSPWFSELGLHSYRDAKAVVRLNLGFNLLPPTTQK